MSLNECHFVRYRHSKSHYADSHYSECHYGIINIIAIMLNLIIMYAIILNADIWYNYTECYYAERNNAVYLLIECY